MRRPLASLGAHGWTLAGPVLAAIAGRPRVAAEPWECTVEDPVIGAVRLTGLFRQHPEARGVLLIVHGLGGSASSGYCALAANAAEAAGLSSLRLSLRGADGRGDDFYHAGLTSDLKVAMAHPRMQAHEHAYVIGYSLGGHVTLRLAVEGAPGLRAVAAICSPLDLGAAARAFDHEVFWAYRDYVLRRLKQAYEAVARRRDVPTPAELVRKVRRVREFDRLTVAPRHGFASEDEYYELESVAPRLNRVRVPSLVLSVAHDPLVPVGAAPVPLEPSAALTIRRFERGGHVRFPPGLDLGLPGPRGLERQVVSWLLSR